MFRYIVKRVLLFIPTLFAVSLLAFGLSRLAPGDPVLQFLVNDPYGTISTPTDIRNAEAACQQAARTLNLDKPAFYFSISSKAYPDTLYKVTVKHRRETLRKLTAQYGNWPPVESWYNGIRSLEIKLLSLPDSVRSASPAFKQALRDLYIAYRHEAIIARQGEMQAALDSDSSLTAALGADFLVLKKQYETVRREAKPGNLRIPVFRWNGLGNQYHTWLAGFVTGDFGVSVYERIPVAKKVKPALFWTLVINLAAIFLAFALAVPLGVWSAVRRGQRFDRVTSLGLFMLFSMPSFWVGTMLLIFFTTREYGMKFFASVGLGNVPQNAAWFEKIWIASPHLILPVLCITYPVLAFIARQMRGSMTAALEQDYVRTARAKGLSERQVVWRHAFRNALFPIITLFASVFPAAIAGSVAIEYIFNIPGMGWLTLNAILQKDWPIVFTVLMLGSVLTIAGMLVADLLYAVADPRVKYARE